MNCYNSEKYLREAIDSVLAQTLSDWEIVFWDNQSTDGSASIVRSYKDERIRYFLSPEHTTLGKARNLAVAQARGQWLGFLDCDDLWFPTKLEKQLEELKKADSSIGLVYCGCQTLFQKTGKRQLWHSIPLEELPTGWVCRELLLCNFIPLLAPIISRKAFESVGGIPESLVAAEDYYLFVAIAEKYSVRVVRETLCTYRVHSENSSHVLVRKIAEESMEILQRWRHCFCNDEEANRRFQEFETIASQAKHRAEYEKTVRYRIEKSLAPLLAALSARFPLLKACLSPVARLYRRIDIR